MAQLGKTNNIFVLCPTFSGGNHLCNLLGLCEGVEPTWLSPKDLLKQYQLVNKSLDFATEEGGLVAHYNNTNNDTANLDRVINYKELLLSQQRNGYINVIQGHHFSFQKFLNQNYELLLEFENVKWIMIETPKLGSLGRQRMDIETRDVIELENPDERYPALNETYLWDTTQLSQKNVNFNTIQKASAIYNICPGYNGVSVDSDIYFSYAGSKYIRSLLKGYFDLELPPIADRIHKLWVDMIEYRVTYDLIQQGKQ